MTELIYIHSLEIHQWCFSCDVTGPLWPHWGLSCGFWGQFTPPLGPVCLCVCLHLLMNEHIHYVVKGYANFRDHCNKVSSFFFFFWNVIVLVKAEAHFNLILKLFAPRQTWPISTKIYFDPGFILIGLFFIPTKLAQFAQSFHLRYLNRATVLSFPFP